MSQELPSLDTDSVLGSYRLVKEIGRGGMGTVFEAHHTTLPRRAAVKILHGELLRLPGMATRMVQEASILEHIRHPGIARVYECALLADHRPWIAMELVEGETLSMHLASVGRLGATEVAMLVANVADVLASVHARGIVHRDLKPDNLIMTPRDRDFPLRLIDWGIARLGPMGKLTLDGLTPGTPIYMSPEQATGRTIAAPCDIYSLGVIAYEALCGVPPFDGKTLAEVVCMHLTSEAAPLTERCTAPAELCALIHSMLAKEPNQRPSSLEVRQVARAASHAPSELRDNIEIDIEVVIDDLDLEHTAALADGSSEIDAAAETDDVTLLHQNMRKPRWTPPMPNDVAVRRPSGAIQSGSITPRALNDQVAGEIGIRRG
ncbi:MAG TPA: serine/threonine-protein kinase [Kofleriaceae bacterium]|jgi:serine/threonine-protein kinase|nr:serine/threonine-protein kinase [Kofleriaceae bacterium]